MFNIVSPKIFFSLTLFFLFSCEEKISQEDINSYKDIMDIRLGHLGNAIIIQGRLLDAYNLRSESAEENHFKEAEELIKENLEKFGRPDELKKLMYSEIEIRFSRADLAQAPLKQIQDLKDHRDFRTYSALVGSHAFELPMTPGNDYASGQKVPGLGEHTKAVIGSLE